MSAQFSISYCETTPKQRLNYGIIFEPSGELYLGQEYWLHTFEIPLPRKLYLPSPLQCNVPICKYSGHVIKMLNALRTETMASLNSTVYQIHNLVPSSQLNERNQHLTFSRSKRGLFDFIGKISKSLFGTATSDDIATIKRHMQVLNKNNAKVVKAMAQQEKHLSSFISTVNARFDNMMDAVSQNHRDSVALSKLVHTSIDALEHEFVILEELILRQTNATTHLKTALDHVQQSIHELIKEKLSPFLITPHDIQSSLCDRVIYSSYCMKMYFSHFPHCILYLFCKSYVAFVIFDKSYLSL